MKQTIKRLYQFLIIASIGVIVFVLFLSTPLFLATNDFSIYNPDWNGCSDLAIKTYETGKLQPTYYVEESELTIGHRSFADYDLEPHNSTIILIGPRLSFSTSEGTYLKNFLNEGGMLLVADDFGTGNDILKKLNTTTRFSGKLLLDLSFDKNASFATMFEFQNTSSPLVKNLTTILGNYPSSLTKQKNMTNVTILIVSTEMSWLDENRNGKQDSKEPKGPFPILAVERYGQGHIVLLSDPSLLINSMKEPSNNNLFRDNLFHYLYQGRSTVIIDESHRDYSTFFYITYIFPTMISWELKAAIVLLVLGAFLVGFTNIPTLIIKTILRIRLRSKEPPAEASIDTILDEVMKKHPSWNKTKLESMVRRLEKP